jgi:hypothetical protein
VTWSSPAQNLGYHCKTVGSGADLTLLGPDLAIKLTKTNK